MKLAINENIIDKASSDIVSNNTGTFKNVDITPEQFAQHIKSGHAFCAQHKNGWRMAGNFTVSGILAVDVDHGLSVQDALDDDFVQNYASILYTTPSHTEEFQRFRIVFELEVPITDAKKMRDAQTGLIQRFGGDKACKDACHMFYGSTTSEPILFGKKLPEQQVDDLIARVEEANNSVWFSGDHIEKKNVRSTLTLEKDTKVKLESGAIMLLPDIPPHTRVYCPKHVDSKASAVTLRTTAGTPGIYCSTCIATYFLKTAWKPRHEYNFDYTWEHILKLPLVDNIWAEDETKVMALSEIFGGDIRVVNSRYLQYDETAVMKEGMYLTPDVIDDAASTHQPNPDAGRLRTAYRVNFIKSPKGTGKTEWLRYLVDSHKAKGISTLLIGHRRSLISSSAKRLGLVSYLGEGKSGNISKTEYNTPTPHYAVCVDSLTTRLDTEIQAQRYDVILIDEVEQVFSHLLADTMKDTRRHILQALKFYLNKAKSIYLLDADLSRTTVQIVDAMLKDEFSWQAIVNQWTPDSKTVNLYKSEHHLVGELLENLEQGKRCFVCANSKKKIEELMQGIASIFGDSKRFISITGDNSDYADQQNLIRNIKTGILKYDAIFVSPALGTGIDITFDHDEQLIDTVFGFFGTRINTHFDIDQQLARVRNPKRVCVWISAEECNFETDANVIKTELQSCSDNFDSIDEETGKRKYRSEPLYEAIYSSVTAMQRASKNKVLKNFRDLKKSNGWIIEDVEKDDKLALKGKGVLDSGKELRKQDRTDGILDADPIGPSSYTNLRNRKKSAKNWPVANEFKMRRYELEYFYREELTPEMLELDNEGKYKNCVKEFELIYLSVEKFRESAERDVDQLVGDQAKLAQRKALYLALFSAAGILTPDNQFDTTKEFECSDLTEFVKECRKRKVKIELLLNIPLRSDLKANAVQQLSTFLKNVGLSLTKLKPHTVNGKKLYTYTLDADALAKIQKVCNWRADEVRRMAWTETLEERDDDLEILKSNWD